MTSQEQNFYSLIGQISIGFKNSTKESLIHTLQYQKDNLTAPDLVKILDTLIQKNKRNFRKTIIYYYS